MHECALTVIPNVLAFFGVDDDPTVPHHGARRPPSLPVRLRGGGWTHSSCASLGELLRGRRAQPSERSSPVPSSHTSLFRVGSRMACRTLNVGDDDDGLAGCAPLVSLECCSRSNRKASSGIVDCALGLVCGLHRLRRECERHTHVSGDPQAVSASLASSTLSASNAPFRLLLPSQVVPSLFRRDAAVSVGSPSSLPGFIHDLAMRLTHSFPCSSQIAANAPKDSEATKPTPNSDKGSPSLSSPLKRGRGPPEPRPTAG
jgi:hypothetical protein